MAEAESVWVNKLYQGDDERFLIRHWCKMAGETKILCSRKAAEELLRALQNYLEI